MRHPTRLGYAIVALFVGAAAPASADIITLATDVDLSTGPFTFGVTPTDTFTLTFDPQEPFDPNPILVRTAGTAATTSFGGFLGIPLTPSVFFTDPPVEIGPDTFPGFNPFPTDTRADFTATLSDLGLRYSIGADDFFGYARFAGSDLIAVAFENAPNIPILASSLPAIAAAPEPAAWSVLVLGVFAMGAARWRSSSARAR